jgi:hypothetical protein
MSFRNLFVYSQILGSYIGGYEELLLVLSPILSSYSTVNVEAELSFETSLNRYEAIWSYTWVMTTQGNIKLKIVYCVLLAGLETRECGCGDPLRWPRDTLYQQMLALISPTSGGRSVGIFRSRTKATEFVLFLFSWKLTIISQYKKDENEKEWQGKKRQEINIYRYNFNH